MSDNRNPFQFPGGDDNRNDRNNNNKNGNKNDKNDKNRPLIMVAIFALLAMFITSMAYNQMSNSRTQEVTYTQFYELVTSDQVSEATISSDRISFRLTEDSTFTTGTESESATESYYEELTGESLDTTYYTALINDVEMIPALKEHGVEIKGTLSSSTATLVCEILSLVIPLAILWIVFGILMRRMGGGSMGMSVGKSTAKVYVEKSTGVTFKDVAGQDEAKESLVEVVDFLHNPGKYTAIGAKLPKGALLVGPPGTGKTLLAKAVAGEAGVPFFSLAGSDFVEMFVGVGASRVRDLFKEANNQAPCIIFIDEIDAIGKSRDTRFGSGNDEREQTLNQLLAEMDGFDTSKGLLVLAATNRPEVLDKALLRPGRFDRRIIVDRPDQKGRLDTLKVHSKNVPMDETVDLEALATATAGLVGSDLANIINEAAICAVKHKRKYVSQKDLFEAFELVAVGGREKKNHAMNEKERKIVAYHEVGHALVAALQKNTEPVQKITIVPRTMGALGYTLQTPEEEKFLESKEELLARISTLMGGRAAEDVAFHTITSGAANDIEQATNIARAMVTRFGMSDTFGMMGLASVQNAYLDGTAALTCGEETAAKIDGEVLAIITNAYNDAKKLLEDNRAMLDQISEFLLEHETISGKEFMKIFYEIQGLDENGNPIPAEPQIEAEAQPQAATEAEETEVSGETAEAVEESSEETEQEPAAEPVQEELSEEQSAEPAQEEHPEEQSKASQPETLPEDMFEEE